LIGWGMPFTSRPSRELSKLLDVLGAEGYDFSKHIKENPCVPPNTWVLSDVLDQCGFTQCPTSKPHIRKVNLNQPTVISYSDTVEER